MTTFEDALKNIYFGICGLYIDQNKHRSRIIAAYPNGQTGVFEMPIRNGLPKLDTTPRLIYHNAPTKMCAMPLGYEIKDLDELNAEFKECFRDAIVKFLNSKNMIDSCHLEPQPYVFYTSGYSRPFGRRGIDQRWFVAFCDGHSFINAEFSAFNPHLTRWTPWVLSKIYMVLEFDQIVPTYRLAGLETFRCDCRTNGYTEIQKPYGRIPLYVSEALKEWHPNYTEVTFPAALKGHESIFIPALRYKSLPLDIIDLDQRGNKISYVALVDDNQTMHKFDASNFKI